MRFYLLLALTAVSAWGSEFSTFIGDSSNYHVARIQADAAGNTYLAGNRSSGDASAVFVMKLDAAGNIVVFNTFSGKGTDTVNDLAVDAAGNFYVAGATDSPYLPLRSAFQATPGPGFVVKFSADAEQVIFSTYFPAAIQALAVDAAGNVYLTGTTNLPAFPVTAGMPAGIVTTMYSLSAASGAFITKLAASGDHILYSGLIAGHAETCDCCSSCFLSARHTAGIAIALDPAGSAYVAGYTDTSDVPTTPGVLLAKGEGAFVVKVNAAGTGLAYLTYLGAGGYPSGAASNPANLATSIAVDAVGNAYVAGSTSDPQFPASPGAYQTTYVTPSPQTSFVPPSDAFVLKLSPAGSAVVWASYLGGKGVDGAKSVALDGAGNAWIVGTTASADFPNAQGWSQGSDFVAEFNATGTVLSYSARFPNGAASQAIAVEPAGMVHVAGPAGLVSTIIPGKAPLPRIVGVANAAYGTAGGSVATGAVISLYGPHIGPSTPVALQPDNTGVMPLSASGLQVMAVGYPPNPAPLPLLYVSDSQINAVLPLTASNVTGLQVVGQGNSPVFPITVLPVAPEIVQNPDGSAVVVNQDGTFNSAGHPAPVGSTVSVWATGVGDTNGFIVSGLVAKGPRATNCCLVQVANVPAPVQYAGDSPGVLESVVQINFVVPALSPYQVTVEMVGVTVEAGGVSSHAASFYVSPPAGR